MRRAYLPKGFDYRELETGATRGFLGPAQLANHLQARLRCSVTAGLDLALMKSRGIIPAAAPLTFTGARVVDDGGTNGYVAAHAIPCGISILGRGPVHSIPKSLEMQSFIADPYRFTNIVPRSANNADTRAEGFRRQKGPGLVRTFFEFSRNALAIGASARGRFDMSALNVAYGELIDGYKASFEYALDNFEHPESGRVAVVPGKGTVVDPNIEYSERDFHEDNIRSALRGQLSELRELEGSPISPMLVDQVETDFHAVAQATDDGRP